jgi:hypothetical protein
MMCRFYLFLAMATILPESIESFGAASRFRSPRPTRSSSLSSSGLHMVLAQSETSETIKTIKERLAAVPKLVVLAAAAAAANTHNAEVVWSDPTAQSLVAAAIGVATVSSATALVEQLTSKDVPMYDLKSERFDQTTFVGRYCKMLLGCDPRLLLYSQDQVRQYKAIAYDDDDEESNNNKYNSRNNKVDDRTLWEAKRIADSALNMETNEWIPRPFRMSGYLPFNGPICVAMVGSTATLPLLLWSWLNQSQNALVNFYNRNASSEMTKETLLMSYAIAVGSALLVAFSLSQYIQTHFVGDEALQLLRFVSFPSAVVASSLNCFIVRSPELESGVPLLNDRFENVLVGETSFEAAKRGVYSTTASRAILQMPTYFIPPLLLDTVEPLQQFLEAHPSSVLPVTTYLLLVIFGVGLPAAVGIFPQMSKLCAMDVEAKYRDLVDPRTNAPFTEFYFNKGL